MNRHGPVGDGQRTNGFVEHNPAMVEDFLKLYRGFVAPMRCKVGFSAHIDWIQIWPVVKPETWQPEFIRSSDLQSIKRLLRVRMA